MALGDPQVRPRGGSRGPSWSQERLQGAQDEAKMAPREPQEDPGWTKGRPKGAQREPKRSQRRQKGTKLEAPEVQKVDKSIFQNRLKNNCFYNIFEDLGSKLVLRSSKLRLCWGQDGPNEVGVTSCWTKLGL